MMWRREFIAGIAGATAWPVVARAQQQADRVACPGARNDGTFLQTAARWETGYVAGRNVTCPL
jgi:hypothetical protein